MPMLKKGMRRIQSRDAWRVNVTTCSAIVEAVRSSLGPRGMDKMLMDDRGVVTVTNDGAAILKEMNVQHPTAKIVIETAKATDTEVGDGAISTVLFAGELLMKADELREKDLHPSTIAEGFSMAVQKSLEVLNEISLPVDATDKDVLERIARTAMTSKTILENDDRLPGLVVDAVLKVAQKEGQECYRVDLDDIQIDKRIGGSRAETKLIDGVTIHREIPRSDMPRRVENASIALIVKPFKLETPREFTYKMLVEKPTQMKLALDEESRILSEKVQKLVECGVDVLLCEREIEDKALYYLAKQGILAIERVGVPDMKKTSKAVGGAVVATVEELTPKDLGYAQLVEERKISGARRFFIEGCKNPKTVTILIRGGTRESMYITEKIIHNALSVTKDLLSKPKVVVGGGAIEMKVSTQLRRYALTLSGKEQLAVQAFAEALEAIPLTLAANSGLDPLDTILKLRHQHMTYDNWAGIDAVERKTVDMKKHHVLEPLAVKEQVMKSAVDVATMILRVDDIVMAKRELYPKPKPEETKPPEN